MIFSREKHEKLLVYVSLLEKWHKKINLISQKTFFEIWDRHILDSAQIYPFVSSASSLVDVGTGAGFPGLVLSIMGLKNVHLVESDQKKIIFLQEVARLTGAEVIIHNCRVEHFQGKRFDFIVSRAFSSLEKFLKKTTHLRFCHSRVLSFKGLSLQKELDQASGKWHFDCEIHSSLIHPEGKFIVLSEIKKIDVV